MTYTPPPVYPRHGTVVKRGDGDTVTMDLDLGIDIGDRHFVVRLIGLDAPEKETPEGVSAREFTHLWLDEHGPVFDVRTIKDRNYRDKQEKYGRYLADLMPLSGGPSLCQALLSAGYAVPYDGGKR